MQITIGCRVKLLVDAMDGFNASLIPKGTEGVVLEMYGTLYCVDVAIPNPNRVGDFEYHNIVVTADQLELVI